jgi:leucyl-tRNA---protein transferase
MVRFYQPERIHPERYEKFLSSGWFRSMHMLYKNELICLEDDILSVVNIRLRLDDFIMKPRHAKNFRKVESRFRIEVGKATYSEAKQELYELSKPRLSGFIHEDIHTWTGPGNLTGFDTREIAVYDGDVLAAFSYFDVANGSVAGLLGVFHPDYARYSLGIYTMLKEVEYAGSIGCKYYYPGYVLQGTDRFDYKLSIGRYDYLTECGHWADIAYFDPKQTAGFRIKMRTEMLEEAFWFAGIDFQRMLYPFYGMGYGNRPGEHLCRHASLLLLAYRDDRSLYAAWDSDRNMFVLCEGRHIPEYDYLFDCEQSDDYLYSERYVRQIIGDIKLLGIESDPGAMAELVKHLVLPF